FDSIFNQTPTDLQTSTPVTENTQTNNIETFGSQSNSSSIFDTVPSQQEVQTPVIPEPINEVSHSIMGNTMENNENTSGISIAEAVQRAMNTEPPVKEETSQVISDVQVNNISDFGTQTSVLDITQNQSTIDNNPLYNELVTPNSGQEAPVFEPIQAQPINNASVRIPDIGNIPDSDILESPTNMPMNNPEPVVRATNDNFAAAIKLLRNCASEMEKLGYYVDIDELDLGNTYQATFKINK
ncbi:MAG: hypothetical protein HFH46_03895, partial [Bacilli bacterium]|nr:hypothetical protein [Bacilli bacterium]